MDSDLWNRISVTHEIGFMHEIHFEKDLSFNNFF